MYIVTGEEMRQVDRYTIDEIGLHEFALMENAGRACSQAMQRSFAEHDRIVVVSGGGNNGGDGFVIARDLAEQGFYVTLAVIAPRQKIQGAALEHLLVYENSGRDACYYETDADKIEKAVIGADIIIDALLGTGVSGKLQAPFDHIAAVINGSAARVFAVDLPSGAPSGEKEDGQTGVLAERTYMLAARKVNASLPGYAACYGEIETIDIGIPDLAYVSVGVNNRVWLDEKTAARHLPLRDPGAHKGDSGRAVIIGGSVKMSGAVMMTAEACIRAGAGRTTVVVPESVLPLAAPQLKEAMYEPLPDESGELAQSSWEQMPSFVHADAAAVGPGLGRNIKNDIFPLLKNKKVPIVIDADALTDLSLRLDELKEIPRQAPLVLTPHPGEMAALTGCKIAEVQAARFSLSAQFAQEYGVYVVLKGAQTVVAAPDGRQWVNSSGNAGLAKGGTGDVLTGMILAFLLQYDDPAEAVYMAVYLHGRTADHLADKVDPVSVNATDISRELGAVIYQLKQACE